MENKSLALPKAILLIATITPLTSLIIATKAPLTV
jgi:hypothetical protein